MALKLDMIFNGLGIVDALLLLYLLNTEGGSVWRD